MRRSFLYMFVANQCLASSDHCIGSEQCVPAVDKSMRSVALVQTDIHQEKAADNVEEAENEDEGQVTQSVASQSAAAEFMAKIHMLKQEAEQLKQEAEQLPHEVQQAMAGLGASRVCFDFTPGSLAPVAAKPDACTESDTEVAYAGFLYRTISGNPKDAGASHCEYDNYHPMPEGYDFAHSSNEVVSNVVKAHGWGVNVIQFKGEDYVWTTKNWHGKGHSIDLSKYGVRESDGKYSVGACTWALLVSKPCA